MSLTMRDVDLPASRYRVQTKNGRWLSRETLPFVVTAALMGLCFIGFAWWNRAELGLAAVVGVTAIGCFGAGLVAGGWLKRFD